MNSELTFPNCLNKILPKLSGRELMVIVSTDLEPDSVLLCSQMLETKTEGRFKLLYLVYTLEAQIYFSNKVSNEKKAKIKCRLKSEFSVLQAFEGQFDLLICNFKNQCSNTVSELKALKRFLKPDGLIVSPHSPSQLSHSIILIGSSTGGTTVIRDILMQLPPYGPPIVIVQHMPEMATTHFAEGLNRLTLLKTHEVQANTDIQRGHVYIAPGGKHLLLRGSQNSLRLMLSDAPPVNNFKPSVDVLFKSSLQCLNGNKIKAVLLTGMGQDGAEGLLEIKKMGGNTIVQNEETCVVFGMPKVALEIGAAEKSGSPHEISKFLTA